MPPPRPDFDVLASHPEADHAMQHHDLPRGDPQNMRDEVEGDADRGVELTADELDALREATRQCLAGPEIVVLAPGEPAHAYWEHRVDPFATVTVARSIEQLQLLLRESVPDCIVIDADGCGCGGPGVLAALRPIPVPCYIVASLPTRTHLISCLAAGADRYFAKPVELSELVAASPSARAS